MTEETTAGQGAVGSPVEQELGLLAERDAVLRQLDDRTNQTWAVKRERWAALVRAQDAEIQRLRAELAAMTIDRDSWADQASQRTQAALDAAVAAERERCAKLCEELEARVWRTYKNGGAANQHTEGRSDGAGECAALIRGA